MLPSDVIVAAEPAPDTPHQVVAADAIPEHQMGLDIGPESARFSPPASSGPIRFLEWPLGVLELSAYADGTRAVAQALAGNNACTVVGGGDAGAAIRALGYSESAFGHVSTGGGASLEFIECCTQPGLAALEEP